MKNNFAKFLALISVFAVAVLGAQVGAVQKASAAPGSADIRLQVYTADYGQSVIYTSVCNDGDETITDVTFEVTGTNFEFNLMVVGQNDGGAHNATDIGTYDLNTDTWSGVLENTQCVNLNFAGDVTGDVGESLSFEFEVVSSVLQGDISNVDPNPSNDAATFGPEVIEEPGDFAITSRLLTQGEITSGSAVSYEVIVSNVGTGALPTNGNVAFIIPDSASFDEVIDADLDDALNLDACFELGPPSSVGPGLADQEGTIVVCLMQNGGTLLPGDSFPLIFNMTATESFSTGDVSVYATVTGDDRDSARVQLDIAQGVNPIVNNYNNIVLLPYNNDELTATINRCPGQGATTSNGNGCFRVSFNKLIWEPSFTIDDLNLSSGNIVSLSKVDDFSWDVQVTGIVLGQSATLTLEEGSVLDFSAIENGVQVLGENVIRYELETTDTDTENSDSDQSDQGTAAAATATGTLPATGTENVAYFATALLLLGLVMLRASKKVLVS